MSESNGHLDKAAILGVSDLSVKELHIPEWGGTVYVRMMRADERDRFEEQEIKAPWADTRARLAVAVLCDKDGNLLFTKEDVPAISGKNGRALDRIYALGMKMNGITKEDVDELKKNSLAILSSGSSTN